jgi:uncharacterized protein (DUF486 family)
VEVAGDGAIVNVRTVATTAGLLVCSNIFMTFAILYMRQPIKLDFLWAGFCLMGAVYFIFRA